MREDRAFLLDQICRRYGGRPSDFLDDLDEYEAFQFDAGMAYRYNAVDQDRKNEDLTLVLNAINGLLRAWGAKNLKNQKYKPIVPIEGAKKKGDIVTGGVTNMTVTEIVEK